MPTCQYCGREIGNAGALAQHERSCDENPTEAGETRPVRRSEARAIEPSAAGEAAGSALAVMDDDLPAGTRLGALQQLLTRTGEFVGNIGEGYQNYRREKLALQQDKMNNVEVSDPDLAIECPRCGYEILPKQVPLQDDTLRCPGGCGKAIQLRDPRAEA